MATSALSKDISEQREQPESNASVDRAAVFDSLGTALVHLIAAAHSHYGRGACPDPYRNRAGTVVVYTL